MILVLLIIFMVAAPLATVDVAVDLPASTAEPQPRPDKPIFLTVKPDLTLALGETADRRATRSAQALDAATKGDKETRIFLRADKAVAYGELMEVMNLLRGAGYLKIALVGLEKTAHERRSSTARWLRWLLSAAAVLLAHGGVAAAILHWHETDDAPPAAAIVIDLAPNMMAPEDQKQDLPPGPEQVQADASPETEGREGRGGGRAEDRDQDRSGAAAGDRAGAQSGGRAWRRSRRSPSSSSFRARAQLAAPATTAPQVPKIEESPTSPRRRCRRSSASSDSNAIPSWKRQVVALLERNKRYPAAARANSDRAPRSSPSASTARAR